jgi:hypothetical protein
MVVGRQEKKGEKVASACVIAVTEFQPLDISGEKVTSSAQLLVLMTRALLMTFSPEMPNGQNSVTAITHALAIFARFSSCLPTTIFSLPCHHCSSLTIVSLIDCNNSISRIEIRE